MAGWSLATRKAAASSKSCELEAICLSNHSQDTMNFKSYFSHMVWK
jgi:hypothetical protein